MRKTVKSFDGTNISYVIERKGDPFIVLLHGIGKDNKIWEKGMEHLMSKGFSVIAPDLRGHGMSDVPKEEEAYFLHNFAIDIDHILNKEKVEKASFVGHSLGGVVSLLYYKLFREKVHSIVLINTTYKVPLELQIKLALMMLLAKFKFSKVDDSFRKNKKTINNVLNQMSKYGKEHYQENMDLLSNISVPTLFIQGTEDECIPQNHMERMSSFINNCTVKKVKAGHENVLGEKLEEVEGHIMEFYNNIMFDKYSKAEKGVIAALLLFGFGISVFSTQSFWQIMFGGGLTGAAVSDFSFGGAGADAIIMFLSRMFLSSIAAGIFYLNYKRH